MGQRVTIGMQGVLQLFLDGSPTRPLEVSIHDIELDLAHLMQQGAIKPIEGDPRKLLLRLDGVTLTLTLDAEEILKRGAESLVAGLESM